MRLGAARTLSAVVLGLGAAGLAVRWAEPRRGVDLLGFGQGPRAEGARPQRIRDVVRESLPAPPPSLHRFRADVPRDGRLVVAAGIPGRHQDESGVEFVVKVRADGRERTLLSRLVDPANHPAHRQWVPLEADLSRYAGSAVEILLETRGYERARAQDRAFWGTPVITSSGAPRAPLVVVYLVDTLRADHLPLYGYPRQTAPELGRLAGDAVVFEQAIASSSWTKPSVASLFTSLPPREHGCVQFYTPLDPSLVTLAERLRHAGFATGAVVANRLVLAKGAHFDQGFSYFAAPPSPQRAEQVVDTALAFLDARRGLPTFLYVHTMDAHTPYQPPPPFDRLFGPPPRPGRGAAEPSDFREPGDLDRIVAQYDGAIAYGDRELGRFLRGLKERGLYEEALIVFLADHGEEFLDHRDWVHGHTLFDELVRVPLVVKYPARAHAGRRVERQVQLVDVLPTIQRSVGLPVPEAIAGRPLDEAVLGTAVGRPAPFETKYREHVAYGVRTESAKYVREFHPEDRELFFDLSRDPRERRGRSEGRGPGWQALRRAAEEASSDPAYALRLRAEGPGAYELRVRTTGWIDRLEAPGLGRGERAEIVEGGRAAVLTLRPRPREARQLLVGARPHGAALWLEGTREGRPLRPQEVRAGGEGRPADTVPFCLPDVELCPRPFRPPPAGRPGISLWFAPTRRGEVRDLEPEAAEDLRALGYLR